MAWATGPCFHAPRAERVTAGTWWCVDTWPWVIWKSREVAWERAFLCFPVGGLGCPGVFRPGMSRRRTGTKVLGMGPLLPQQPRL